VTQYAQDIIPPFARVDTSDNEQDANNISDGDGVRVSTYMCGIILHEGKSLQKLVDHTEVQRV
jgi:hypothetical protein